MICDPPFFSSYNSVTEASGSQGKAKEDQPERKTKETRGQKDEKDERANRDEEEGRKRQRDGETRSQADGEAGDGVSASSRILTLGGLSTSHDLL